MFKILTREITDAIQARSGASTAVVAWMAVIVLALVAAAIFLSVAGYDWLALHNNSVTAGLIMAGVFVAIAIVAAVVCVLLRRRVRERAILARTVRAQSPSWLLDPRLLGAAVHAGRSAGWQRILPVLLVGVLVAQWAREPSDKDKPHS